MLNNSTKVPYEEKPSENSVVTKENKDGVVICRKYPKENHFARDFKVGAVKDKTYYLIMAHKLEEKQKEKAFVAHVPRVHQVWSSGDEIEETENKRKRGKQETILKMDQQR